MILSLMEPYVIIYLFYYLSDIQLTTQDLRAVYASRLDLDDQMDPNSAIIRALSLTCSSAEPPFLAPPSLKALPTM